MDQSEYTQQQAALREALANCTQAVAEGCGAVLIVVTENSLKVEAFNCSEEELHSVLSAAHDVVANEPPVDGDTLQ